MRISLTRRNQLKKLAELKHSSVSEYLDRVIESSYHRFFDEKGDLIENSEIGFYDKL